MFLPDDPWFCMIVLQKKTSRNEKCMLHFGSDPPVILYQIYIYIYHWFGSYPLICISTTSDIVPDLYNYIYTSDLDNIRYPLICISTVSTSSDIAPDLRGYGLLHAMEPSEDAVYEVALTTFRFLVDVPRRGESPAVDGLMFGICDKCMILSYVWLYFDLFIYIYN